METRDDGVVIVGGGYAGLCCAQRIREMNPNIEITILNQEPFCSRPNLFFRFKFLHWHEKHFDYNAGINTSSDDSSAFHKKHNIKFLDNHTAKRLNVNDSSITVVDMNTNEEKVLQYSRLCLATGGVPNLILYPTIASNSDKQVFFNDQQQVAYDKYVGGVENVFAVRNVEEIQLVYSAIKQLHDRDDVSKNIVIVGSGALALDIVTHIIDGYESVWNHHNKQATTMQSKIQREIEWELDSIKMQQLPKLIIVSRKDTIAYPLLQDNQASRLITDLVSKGSSEESNQQFQISQYVELITCDSVESIVTSEVKSTRDQVACTGIRTSQGKTIDCSVIIQAVGVKSNHSLASEAGLKVGSKGGILVNERFQTFHEQTGSVVDNIYAAGDCAEMNSIYIGGGNIGSDYQTFVWKNWTSAREQAIECASSIVNGYETKGGNLWFNQTTRLFGLYVACLGMYHHEESDDSVSVLKSSTATNKYSKLVFHRINVEQRKLIGSLVIGPDMTDYKLGSNLLDLLRTEMLMSDSLASKLIDLSAAQWTTLLKSSKENRKNGAFTLSSEQETQVLNTVATPTVKKVNPLLAKRAAAARKNPVASSSQKNSATVDDDLSKNLSQKLQL